MFDKFKSLFTSGPDTAQPDTVDDLKMAFAALLVEAACADDNYDEIEKALITRMLRAKFDIDEAAATALRAHAEDAQTRATDIQRFTRHAKEMPLAERVEFIENLWEVILSDSERDAYEDALVRRICGLIYIEDRISGEARRRVEAKLSQN